MTIAVAKVVQCELPAASMDCAPIPVPKSQRGKASRSRETGALQQRCLSSDDPHGDIWVIQQPGQAVRCDFRHLGQVARATPQARLLAKGKPPGDVVTRTLFLSRLGERGIEAQLVSPIAD